MKNLDILYISQCSVLEYFKVDWTRYRKEAVAPNGFHNPKIINFKGFHGLHTVEIDRSPMLRDLTCLIFAPNLKRLSIINCKSLTEVLKKGVTESWINVGEILTPFPKLERLYFSSVPELRISFSLISFLKE